MMEVSIVTPETELFSGEASQVYARSVEGELGILPGHQPILVALAEDAQVRVTDAGGAERAFDVSGGFLQFRDGRLTVLADEGSGA
ncbi:MAG: F0F1 ATP synthase subunit epsilon [Euzebyales bacterium]|nr:F0F1 ATP synthase subunit epsilon [Euzebyales bacterium]